MYIAYDENIDERFKRYFPIMKAVTGLLGNQCETVIHDFSNHNESIVAMMGNVTERQLYAPLTSFVLEILKKEGDEAEDRIGYITYYKGKPYRCSTIFIRDGKELIGCLCINYCVQDFFALKRITEQLTTSRSVLELEKEAKDEYFAQSVEDFVDNTVQKIIARNGKDLTKLTKAERLDLIRQLDQTGVFLVKGTVEMLAERMNMSKYTIYNDIDEVRK
ncbi:hypothetical protein GCM10010978_00840 [Compostibacillus humi]|uniref:Transcriptional regulator YheO n=1 Tax=Compostibacillus humi TaxID=1245525 RepID=A0A8J3EIX7_9BACI|nr:PAS domain-containing protein [Compostibacillus humi]GGH68148.1 hypothetical protein GCM10010978_00840 [Compostibacillus humi]